MERGGMGEMHEGAQRMYVLKEQLKSTDELFGRIFDSLNRPEGEQNEQDEASLQAANKDLLDAHEKVMSEYKALAAEMSAEHKAKFEEWNRLVQQEETLFDDVAERLSSFTSEEYKVILGQMSDVHERRKKLGTELDQIFESLES